MRLEVRINFINPYSFHFEFLIIRLTEPTDVSEQPQYRMTSIQGDLPAPSS